MLAFECSCTFGTRKVYIGETTVPMFVVTMMMQVYGTDFSSFAQSMICGSIVSAITHPISSTTCTNSTTLFLPPLNLSPRLLYSQPATSDPPPHTISPLPWESLVVHAPPHSNDRPHKPHSNKIAHRSAHWKACGTAIRKRTWGRRRVLCWSIMYSLGHQVICHLHFWENNRINSRAWICCFQWWIMGDNIALATVLQRTHTIRVSRTSYSYSKHDCLFPYWQTVTASVVL